MDKIKAKYIYDVLDGFIENPKSELNYTSVFELLVAVILSAQCTDKRVNIVTQKLFKTHFLPEHFAYMNQSELEQMIYSTGFYRNKAKNIISASKDIIEKHNGNVPSDFDSLTLLAGVGRKTANVVLITAFNTPAIAVDTHVFRVSNRLALADAKNVNETEKQLSNLYDPKLYAKLHHLLILFGRYTCTARNPKCAQCPLKNVCKYYAENIKNPKNLK